MNVIRTFFSVFAVISGLLAAQGVLAQGLPAQGALTQERTVLDRWAEAIEAKLALVNSATTVQPPPVGLGSALKLGSSGERVNRLAASLEARGWLARGAYHGHYDAAVDQAVRAFQGSEGMVADGRVGETTIDALDRTSAVAAAALTGTLTEIRSLAADSPAEFFLVNIPSQTAYLINRDQVVMSMRVAVGRPSRETPILEDEVTEVILNPTWTAPPTVLSEDKLPALRRTGHPGIGDATVYLDHEIVDPTKVDWTTVTPDRIRIVQSAGNQNALGHFKFNLTNDEAIYLHDTNDRSIFARQARALSSGCVRLANPRGLAETLLGRAGWTPERITKAVDTRRTQAVTLSNPLPVRIVYWLVTVDENVVRLHKDIYGRTNQSVAALARKTTPAKPPTSASPVSLPTSLPASMSSRQNKEAQLSQCGDCLPGIY